MTIKVDGIEFDEEDLENESLALIIHTAILKERERCAKIAEKSEFEIDGVKIGKIIAKAIRAQS